MKKKLFVVILLVSALVLAQIPENYYQNAEGKTGMELKQALHEIIKGHTSYPYTSSNTDLWDILKEADQDTANPDNVILLYTGFSVDGEQEYAGGDGWSREHVWAKSHGGFDDDPPTGTDAHNLHACDISVNSSRSDKDFDNGGSPHSEATECFYDADSWEPRDAVKGDVARTMLYMATRYEGTVSNEPDLELIDVIPSSGPTFGKLSTLMEWHNQDPVDDFERNRNDVVFSYQNNRNPFIDHPEYADSIWGTGNAPAIISVNQLPAEPMSSEDVEVEAEFIDPDGLASTVLNYGLQSGNYSNQINMQQLSSDTYSGTIPAQNLDDTVYYQITAEDNQGYSVTTLEYSYVVREAFVENVLIEETFEDDLGNMSHYSITGSQVWEWGNYRDPVSCAQVSGYDNREYENSDWLLTPPFDLTNYDQASLQFQEAINYDDNNVDYDQSVWISSDYPGSGSPRDYDWDKLTVEGRASGSSWDFVTVEEVDLSDYVDSTDIYIGFWYTSTSSSASTWEIDNIVVKAIQDTGSSSIENGGNQVAGKFELLNNYPNPFNAETTIEYSLPVNKNVQLNIYDLSGKHITTLVDNYQKAGKHTVKWNATGQASGVYLIQLRSENRSRVRKSLLIK